MPFCRAREWAAAQARVRVVEIAVGTGLNLLRDPVPYLKAAGFRVEQCRRSGRGGIGFRVRTWPAPVAQSFW
ncbi:hypothetical protein GCM10009764_66970 [Nocardia ninae]